MDKKSSATRTTITDIKNHKNATEPLVCLTAYTAPMAEILDSHCDMLLVGDSMGMALYGMESTIGVSVEMMINHGKAVMRRAQTSCVVVDMPYGSYESDKETALSNAREIYDRTQCHAVKLEGGLDIEGTIAHIVQNGIPVIGHIGLQPQSVEKDGGYKIKGKTDLEIVKLLEDAKAVERAGASGVVIEGVIEDVATHLTQSISIPTIGIGASAACDGQILVTEDMLGMLLGHTPKFAKQYAKLADDIETAVKQYCQEVKTRQFPSTEYTYHPKSK